MDMGSMADTDCDIYIYIYIKGRGFNSWLGLFNYSLGSCNVNMDEIYVFLGELS